MTLPVVFRRAARRKFDEAALWYEARRAGLGSQFISEINNAINLCGSIPSAFPSCTATFDVFDCVAFLIPSFSARRHDVSSC